MAQYRHWDCRPIDALTMDARIAGSGSWKRKMYEFHSNIAVENLVEIGERGMLESKETVREFLKRGAHFYPMWKVRTELGIDGLLGLLTVEAPVPPAQTPPSKSPMNHGPLPAPEPQKPVPKNSVFIVT